MIPSNELRIGSWVYDNVLNGYVQFKSFFGLCNAETKPEQYSPIPLTPEVLEKCGFKKDTIYPDWMKLHIGNSTVIKANDGDAWVEKIANDEEYSVGLGGAKYLHQLQTLYWYLCGKELTINL